MFIHTFIYRNSFKDLQFRSSLISADYRTFLTDVHVLLAEPNRGTRAPCMAMQKMLLFNALITNI